jgi:UDP:flavonoid glycosyltransferase YjiC (YdhE family)
MFSRVLTDPQPDWPPNVRITGGVRYDGTAEEAQLPRELRAFLDAGDPPIVFALGSAAVGAAGSFYEESARAALALGRRAVLVIGRYAENRPAQDLPPEILVAEYAPYSELFARAAAVVHQGGIGTMHQALAAGHPMVVAPFSHDQPDNAHRAERLGIAKTLYPSAYRADRAARALDGLLGDPVVLGRAEEIGTVVRAERGASTACDAIEEVGMST